MGADYAHHITAWHPRLQNPNTSLIICVTSKIFRFYSKQGQQQNLDSDDETDSDGTIDDKYNLCKEKGPSRRSLAIQSGCKVNRHYLLIIMTLVVEYQFWFYKKSFQPGHL